MPTKRKSTATRRPRSTCSACGGKGVLTVTRKGVQAFDRFCTCAAGEAAHRKLIDYLKPQPAIVRVKGGGPPEILVRRLPLKGGYTSGGKYYGEGAPLFAYEVDFGGNSLVEYGDVRAADKDAAKAKLRKQYPGAKFVR